MRSKILSILVAVVGLVCCQPNIVPYTGPGSTLEVPAEGASYELELHVSNRWSIVNDNDWIYITPTAGIAGRAQFTVNVEPNTTLSDRQGMIYVIDGAKTLYYAFSQECLDIISTDNDTYRVPETGSFVVRVRSSVGFVLSTGTPWIHLPEKLSYEPQDGEIEVRIALEDNTLETEREGSILFTTLESENLTIRVIQSGHVEVDWTRTFYKRPLVYRFTGDWCGYCPNLEYDIATFNREEPGRLSVMCFYDLSSSPHLSYKYSTKFESRFSAFDKPTLVIDERGYCSGVASPGYLSVMKKEIEEEKSAFLTRTAIAVQTVVEGGKICIYPTVFIKDSGKYHIHVAVLESGLVVAQSDYTGLYTQAELSRFVHNNVVREYLTPLLVGEEFTAAKNSVKAFSYTADIPSSVENRKNMSVAVYITAALQQGPRTVPKFNYYKDRSELVDNSVIVNVGNSESLRYE